MAVAHAFEISQGLLTGAVVQHQKVNGLAALFQSYLAGRLVTHLAKSYFGEARCNAALIVLNATTAFFALLLSAPQPPQGLTNIITYLKKGSYVATIITGVALCAMGQYWLGGSTLAGFALGTIITKA